MKGLIDTSVFVGMEQGRDVADVPKEIAVSVLTIAELHLGVLLAEDPATRAVRLRTLTDVERTCDALPVDDVIARVFADIVAEARSQHLKLPIVDTLIAATAVANGLPVFTQDAGFTSIPRVQVIRS